MRWATEIVSVWLQVRLVVLLLLHRVSFCCYYRLAAAVWCTISSRSAAPCRRWSLEVLCNWTTRGGRMGLPWNNSHLKWAIRRVFEKIFHIYWTWHRIAAVDQCLVVFPSMFENAFNSSTKVLQSVQSSGGWIHVELRSKCVVVNVYKSLDMHPVHGVSSATAAPSPYQILRFFLMFRSSSTFLFGVWHYKKNLFSSGFFFSFWLSRCCGFTFKLSLKVAQEQHSAQS